MPYITSANIACGFHGGDPHVIRKTVALALQHKVALGAHPSLPDLMGFGRRVMDVTPAELRDYVCYQTGRRPRVLPGRRRGPPAREASRHPLHDGRAAGGDRRRDRPGRAGLGRRAHPHDARLGQVRRALPEDGHPRRVRGVRRPGLRGGRDAGLPAEGGRPHHGPGEGRRAGRPDGVRGQGAHDRRRRHRHLRPDHLLPRRHAGSGADRPRGARAASTRRIRVRPLGTGSPRHGRPAAVRGRDVRLLRHPHRLGGRARDRDHARGVGRRRPARARGDHSRVHGRGAEVEAGGYRSYREVLADSARGVAARLGWRLDPARASFLAESVPSWVAFPDTNAALERLHAAGYALGILSNIDDDLLTATRRHFTDRLRADRHRAAGAGVQARAPALRRPPAGRSAAALVAPRRPGLLPRHGARADAGHPERLDQPQRRHAR